ncbi:hypothetical protein [Bacillus suaedae]|uniref:Uncharacterized protein n=1 Tax=Halalkalibacter suaedae TaxID=2822140 RepID=A0A940WS94_9BACI|nr:hypothetical protein [Bacillus suaedae]MBP3951545.1 hypothetical protein [Bacillus suaedae]
MMRVMFILAALCIPFFAYIDKGATGILLGLFFMILGAFFSKPRFGRDRKN